MTVLRTILVAAALSSVVVGCEDPAKDVAKATTESAKPVPANTAAKPATSVASSGSASASASASGSATAASSAGAASPTDKPAGALGVTPENSKIEFIGSKVTGKHEGVFEKFTGWLTVDGDKAETTKAFIEIDMASLKTENEKLNTHLKTDDFFSVEKFPKGTFIVTGVKAGGEKGATHTITGNLKLRDVEKSVSFPATIDVKKDLVSAKAEFAINRKDWGIVYAGKKDDLIRDEVVIKLNLALKR